MPSIPLKTCAIYKCTTRGYITRGYCRKHYKRFMKYGEPLHLVRESHGMTKTPEYHIWADIIQRCTNPNREWYKDYGGRGIKVCERWRYSFTNFYADMGARPSDKHSVERVNVNGDYSPENCIWATAKIQGNNRRNNRHFEFQGRSQTLSQWCDELGLVYNTVYQRIYDGWEIKKALTTKKLR